MADRLSLWLGPSVILAVLAVSGIVEALWPDTFYRISQEDGPVEWATVWAFVLAAAAHLGIAATHRGMATLYGLTLAVFCIVVAGEEISWGQRLFGFSPSTYFLANNEQQEFTWHNTVEDGTRKLALQAVLLGYGLVLPLLVRWDRVRPLAERFGVVAPPISLAVGFVATWGVYVTYPWRFAGEWVELAMGIGFLLGAWSQPGVLLKALAGVAFGATVTPLLLAGLRTEDPEASERAVAELAALHEDWRQGNLRTDCGLHRRLYHVVTEDDLEGMNDGAFAALGHRSKEQTRFFLDPWSQPYWVMDRCDDDGTRRIRVYSFGPNRRRDSTHAEVRPDDVAETILEWVAQPEEP
ncbi:MAG: hypothetical protein JRH01_13830 [Deltaproteobacteria bacterium]|nr:hypothetical protein [Deltaproteobacteria bacterium]MBW2395585.1 hypothetical protein [Deltaproteobacteria bacterium]